MDPQLSEEGCAPTESFPTVAAVTWLLSIVDPLVYDQVSSHTKGFLILVSGIEFLRIVDFYAQ